MRVHFVNRFYWPDEPATAQLLTDLAEALVARGHEVGVVSSRPPGSAAREVRAGVRIERVGGTRAAEAGLAGKVRNFAAFALGARRFLGHVVQSGDLVVVLTDPPLLGAAVAAPVRRRGGRLVHWIQDIYPEVALALGAPRALGCLRPLRDRAWRGAAACVTLGEDMAAVVAAGGVAPARIHVVPNWPPVGLAPPPPERVAARRAAWGLGGKFVVEYAGNLGRVHDLSAVLEAALELRGEPGIVFLFVGGGARRLDLEREVARRGLRNVLFRPAQSRGELAETLAAGDVHLVCLRAGCERYVFPSKLYGAAAVGRPVLFVGPPGAEPARIALKRGFGLAFAPDAPRDLVQALRRLAAAPEEAAALGAAAARFAAAGGFAEAWERILGPAAAAPDK